MLAELNNNKKCVVDRFKITFPFFFFEFLYFSREYYKRVQHRYSIAIERIKKEENDGHTIFVHYCHARFLSTNLHLQ